MKRFLQLALVLVVSLSLVTSVKAAGEITADEQKLLDYASSTFEVGGKEFSSPKIAAMVKRYLTENNVTANVVTSLLADAKDMVKVLQDAKTTDVSKLSAKDKTTLKNRADSIAAQTSVTFDYDAKTNTVSVSYLGEEYGELTLTGSNTLVPTGANYAVYIIVSGLVAIAAVVLYRKSKVNA